MRASTLFMVLAIAQGIYYVLSGLWPLLSITTFQKVTGPKIDLWLVKTIGVLILVIGAVLLIAGLRRQPSLEIVLLGGGSALGLTAVDIVYVSKGRISSVYLLDALPELLLILGWGVVATQLV